MCSSASKIQIRQRFAAHSMKVCENQEWLTLANISSRNETQRMC